MAILNLDQVKNLTSLSRTSIWRLEREAAFPARVQVSARRVGWRSEDVQAWLEARQPVKEG